MYLAMWYSGDLTGEPPPPYLPWYI